MACFLFVHLGLSVRVDSSSDGVSPLAWVIIGALVTALVAVCSFAKIWTDRMYADLKACNSMRKAQEEETLGTLKVLRLQMEKSKGGKPR